MIKNLGGVFGRNPTFNNVEVEGDLTVEGSIIGAVAAGGSNTQVQFNNAGVLDANAGLTYDSATETLRFRSHPTRYLTIGPDGVGASAISAYGNRALALNSSDYNVEISATNGSVSIDSPEVTITSNMGVGGVITGTNTTTSTSSTTGAVIIAGGVGIAKDSFVNGLRIGVGGTGTGISATNAAFGVDALGLNTGTNCLGIGNAAGYSNSGGNVTAYGNASCQSNSGTNVVAIGGSTLANNTASNCVAVGHAALFNNSGVESVGIGVWTIGTLGAGSSGAHNVGIGHQAGSVNTTGARGTFIGRNSGVAHTTGVDNTFVGSTSGDICTTGTLNVCVGSNADLAASGNTNSIVIGASAVGLGSNTTVIGTSATTANRVFGLNSTGQVAPTIASASTIAPTKQISFVSGTTAIVTITAPTGIATTGGQITLIPTGIFTTTTAGNIALASTAVVSRALIMTYDATTAKWYPSY